MKYLAFFTVFGWSIIASGQVLDFTTFTLDPFPPVAGDSDPEWTTTPNTATIPNGRNTYFSVLYSPEDIINKRVRGFITPGTVGSVDNDFIGVVFGYQPGNALPEESSDDANYFLLDWKGEDQVAGGGADPEGAEPFHDLTPDGLAPVGLALSRVTGLPNSDELWQHRDYPESTLGGRYRTCPGYESWEPTLPR